LLTAESGATRGNLIALTANYENSALNVAFDSRIEAGRTISAA
jgi:hypothetical protein